MLPKRLKLIIVFH